MQTKTEPIKLLTNGNHEILSNIKWYSDIISTIPKDMYISIFENSEDLNFADEFGNSPLHLVFDIKNPFIENDIVLRSKIIEMILCRQRVFVQNNKGETPLHAAVKNTAYYTEKLMDDPESEFLNAIVEANIAIIEKILKATPTSELNSLLNWKDKEGLPSTKYLEFCLQSDEMILYTLLLNQGAFIYQDNKGDSILHKYAKHNQHELIDELFSDLDNSVKETFLSLKNNDGKTASQVATAAGHLRICQILHEYKKELKTEEEEHHRCSLSCNII